MSFSQDYVHKHAHKPMHNDTLETLIQYCNIIVQIIRSVCCFLGCVLFKVAQTADPCTKNITLARKQQRI